MTFLLFGLGMLAMGVCVLALSLVFSLIGWLVDDVEPCPVSAPLAQNRSSPRLIALISRHPPVPSLCLSASLSLLSIFPLVVLN